MRSSNKFTSSKEQSAGIPTEVAVSLQALFRLFMTCSLIILLINLHTVCLESEDAFYFGNSMGNIIAIA